MQYTTENGGNINGKGARPSHELLRALLTRRKTRTCNVAAKVIYTKYYKGGGFVGSGTLAPQRHTSLQGTLAPKAHQPPRHPQNKQPPRHTSPRGTLASEANQPPRHTSLRGTLAPKKNSHQLQKKYILLKNASFQQVPTFFTSGEPSSQTFPFSYQLGPIKTF